MCIRDKAKQNNHYLLNHSGKNKTKQKNPEKVKDKN